MNAYTCPQVGAFLHPAADLACGLDGVETCTGLANLVECEPCIPGTNSLEVASEVNLTTSSRLQTTHAFSEKSSREGKNLKPITRSLMIEYPMITFTFIHILNVV